jgi:MerR family transcriptional regulator, light-induced transcriptional regulator
MTSADEPMYNIGAVARLTGIAEATLRVWERRYQFPRTTRTTGRHRLYASREVRRLQWVRQHIAQGMHPRLAIEALVRAEAAGSVPPVAPAALAVPAAGDEVLQSYQQRLLQALVAYQHDAAAAVLAEAEARYAVETVARDLIGSVFCTIGESWRAGELDVATEHFATGILLDYLRAAMRATQPDAAVRPVGLACAPGELHEGSLLILGVLLGRLHWPVLYLGQSFPLSDLAPLVAHARPSVVVFVAMSEATALALVDWPRQMPADAAPPVVAFGGRAFSEHPELIGRVSGQFLGATLQEGSATLHRMLLAQAGREG